MELRLQLVVFHRGVGLCVSARNISEISAILIVITMGCFEIKTVIYATFVLSVGWRTNRLQRIPNLRLPVHCPSLQHRLLLLTLTPKDDC